MTAALWVSGDAAAATLSFQARASTLKKPFMARYPCTPLGILTDYWGRTEAQPRGWS